MRFSPKLSLRVLFGATILYSAVQLPLIYILKGEPYPALAMPSFAGHPGSNGVIEKREPLVDVRFADGHAQPVSYMDILPPTRVLVGRVFETAFSDERFTKDPQTVAWLESRVDALFPSATPTGIDISWQTVQYRVGERVPSSVVSAADTIRVDFSGKS